VLANYASDPSKSKGRLYQETRENFDSIRDEFQRDQDRIVHSASFRRLQYKTQVFANHEGDHYRTRLTHSQEVARIAGSIARNLDLNQDLAETISLAHDLGHAPFGHAGEDALNEVLANGTRFDHNAQTFKIITCLEKRYAEFDGLNLTWESLEGIIKHNGPIKKNIHPIVEAYCQKQDLLLDTYPSLEAQISGISDDIAYCNHDVEDGIRSGLIAIEDLAKIDLIYDQIKLVSNKYPGLETQRLIYESIRRVMRLMIKDLIDNTKLNIKNSGIETIEDVRNYHKEIVEFSSEIKDYHILIKSTLKEKVYNHYKVSRMTNKAKRIVKDLFKIYMNDSDCLPTNWRKLIIKGDEAHNAMIVVDYIAGMTDRFAIQEYKSFFDLEPSIRFV